MTKRYVVNRKWYNTTHQNNSIKTIFILFPVLFIGVKPIYNILILAIS